MFVESIDVSMGHNAHIMSPQSARCHNVLISECIVFVESTDASMGHYVHMMSHSTSSHSVIMVSNGNSSVNQLMVLLGVIMAS